MKKKSVFGTAYNVLIFLFLYAPILVMIVFSFNSIRSRSRFGGFSLQWYARLFQDKAIMDSLWLSLIIAVSSAVIATIIGTLAAVGIHSMKRTPRRMFLAVNNIPIVNPEIVTAVSMMILFVFVFRTTGLMEMGVTTLLIGHITFNIPYVILSVMPKLRQMNKHTFDAAMDLGCSPVMAFFKVVIPEIMPGIVTGIIMAFTLSLDDFVISYFISGSSAQTLPVTIYAMTKKPFSPKINALSTLLFFAVLFLLVIVNLRQIKDGRKKKGAY